MPGPGISLLLWSDKLLPAFENFVAGTNIRSGRTLYVFGPGDNWLVVIGSAGYFRPIE